MTTVQAEVTSAQKGVIYSFEVESNKAANVVQKDFFMTTFDDQYDLLRGKACVF